MPPKGGGEGKYLRELNSAVLSCADFKDRDEIELREVGKHISIVNRCGDEDVKQDQVDLELTGLDFLIRICGIYKYPNAREYELHVHKASAQAPTKRRSESPPPSSQRRTTAIAASLCTAHSYPHPSDSVGSIIGSY